jgi:hypothetical protein
MYRITFPSHKTSSSYLFISPRASLRHTVAHFAEAASARLIPASVESAASVWWPLRVALVALGGATEPASSIVVGGGVGNVARPAAV